MRKETSIDTLVKFPDRNFTNFSGFMFSSPLYGTQL
jgi:hypothetical protein